MRKEKVVGVPARQGGLGLRQGRAQGEPVVVDVVRAQEGVCCLEEREEEGFHGWGGGG